jgi:hypothetical protein
MKHMHVFGCFGVTISTKVNFYRLEHGFSPVNVGAENRVLEQEVNF